MRFPFFLVFIFGSFFFTESFAQTLSENSVPLEKIHTITEFEATFPGGQFARNKYFYSFIENNRKEINSDGAQFCYLKFVVDKEGNISDITTNNSIGTKLEEVLIAALKKSPKWIPARHKGVKVNAYTNLTFIFEPKKSGRSAFAKNTIKFYVTKKNNVEKEVQKILVLVAGTVPARIFTDNMYENLKKDLKNNNVETEYIFLGNERKLALDNFMNVSRSKSYDAILLFIQEDGAKINEIYYETEISIRSVSLKQSMNIFLIEPGDLDTSIMETKVFMNFQLMNKSAYSKASKDLLTILQQNKIIHSKN